MQTKDLILSVLASLVVGLLLYVINDLHTKVQALEAKENEDNTYKSIPRTANPCGCGQH